MCATRNTRLVQTRQLHFFRNEADAISTWIEDKLALASSADVGHDVQTVEELLNELDGLLQELSLFQSKLTILKNLVLELKNEKHEHIEVDARD